jgi:hypothetical protein
MQNFKRCYFLPGDAFDPHKLSCMEELEVSDFHMGGRVSLSNKETYEVTT